MIIVVLVYTAGYALLLTGPDIGARVALLLPEPYPGADLSRYA